MRDPTTYHTKYSCLYTVHVQCSEATAATAQSANSRERDSSILITPTEGTPSSPQQGVGSDDIKS